MNRRSLTVAEILTRLQQAVVGEFPGPVWVRGEVSGYRRTSGGAAFFRLADPEIDDAALEVVGRGRIMADTDRVLGESGLGRLRDGVEIEARGTIGVAGRNSTIRLSLLEIDPAFTAGRLALGRAEVMRRMTLDGSLAANGVLSIPLVPLRVGLITSRGSAAHGDFTDQLGRSPFRFSVKTAHTMVQGDAAAERLAASLGRFTPDTVDMLAVIRGGGSKLDLAVFDTEMVARAVAAAPVPVITGIGHDMDRTVADEAAAIAEKTPSAAGEWLVTRVREFADRIDRARVHIRREGRSALQRHRQVLRRTASDIVGGAATLRRQEDLLQNLGKDVSGAARLVVTDHRTRLAALGEWFSAIDLERTLGRGFAIVTTEDGTVVKSVVQVSAGDRLSIRLADGTVRVQVSGE